MIYFLYEKFSPISLKNQINFGTKIEAGPGIFSFFDRYRNSTESQFSIDYNKIFAAWNTRLELQHFWNTRNYMTAGVSMKYEYWMSKSPAGWTNNKEQYHGISFTEELTYYHWFSPNFNIQISDHFVEAFNGLYYSNYYYPNYSNELLSLSNNISASLNYYFY